MIRDKVMAFNQKNMNALNKQQRFWMPQSHKHTARGDGIRGYAIDSHGDKLLNRLATRL